ncbi:mannose-1-phosphate guanylyltransferase/mannose-6-phosphate isomerase [Thalassotalea nanhaiensis]|uniref:mannose-1-phosphate guanylyltransferase n=1 Tax=Thalassotalea nanhaiensis TaxID=3065648 RepID=A0ABY9TNC4_9GAMM|nr:mannose-1-phosphate guanylyltransferase/mannose-6-phosphate isomerase [Colwelliaceae bacterium SQ345]
MIKPVILAGGSGTRLWPLSRTLYPKQFLKINSEYTLIQDTVNRLSNLPCELPLTICNEDHRFIAAEQLRAIDRLGPILLEPVGKNTAPAIALAALSCISNDEDPILLVLSADHVIENVAEFERVVNNSVALAQEGKLITFGIVPTHAETGYGYIKKGDKRSDSQGINVDSFVEKPNQATAEQYLNCGEYLWNSGMFMFKASRYIEELKKYRADIYKSCYRAMAATSTDLDFIRIDAEEFGKCPSDSIDYAVMEPLCKSQGSDSVVVMPLAANWSDIGSFSAIWDVSDKDQNNNVHTGDVLSHHSTNNLIMAENMLVTTVGIENTVVIQTKDAVLVASKGQGQDVKAIVNQLSKLNRSEAEIHRQVYRPWGSFDDLDQGSSSGNHHKVKRIMVNPGEKLSMQIHKHRAEHWVVVSGSAKVTNGDDTFLLIENQSTYIPAGVKHSLENPGQELLEIIEVQTGSYLGEDDIVRFEDRYGRT